MDQGPTGSLPFLLGCRTRILPRLRNSALFRYVASPHVELTVGSLDHPGALEPRNHYGIESQVPWHVIADDLPRKPTNTDSSYLKGATFFQDPRGATESADREERE